MDYIPPVVLDILANWESVKVATDGTIESIEKINAAGDTTGAKFGALGTKMANAFLFGAVGVGAAATDLAYKYQEALDQIQLQGHLTNAQMGILKTQILGVSTATATSTGNIASGYLQATKAGLTLSQAQQAVTSSAQFANAESGDLNSTLQAALNIQAMHIAGTNSVTQTLDIFTNAIKNSRLTADTLSQAMSGRALSAFAAYHVDLATATALLAGFANQGMNGARAQMSLATGLSALDKPIYSVTGKLSTTAQVLAGYGINAATVAEEARKPGGLLTVIGQLNQAWQTNANATERATGEVSFFNQVFGSSGGRAFYNLISQLPQLQKLRDMMMSPGATKSAFETWLSSPAGTLSKFKTTMENALIPLGDYLLPKAQAAAQWVTSVMNLLNNNKGLGSVVTSLAGAILAGVASAKVASVGIAIAEAFGATVTAGLATTIGSAIAVGIMTGIAVLNVGGQSNSDYAKAHAEWQQNKAGGVVDMFSLFVNTLTSTANNAFLKYLPGSPQIPQLGLLGPNMNRNTGLSGFPGNASSPKKTTHTINVNIGRGGSGVH
jgi:TP901 family phage tail tape measure protein